LRLTGFFRTLLLNPALCIFRILTSLRTTRFVKVVHRWAGVGRAGNSTRRTGSDCDVHINHLSNQISKLPGVLESADRTSSYTFAALRQATPENSLQTRIARLATDCSRLDSFREARFDAGEQAVPAVSPQSLTASGYSFQEITSPPCSHARRAFYLQRKRLFPLRQHQENSEGRATTCLPQRVIPTSDSCLYAPTITAPELACEVACSCTFHAQKLLVS
jgi:hypothetical protein